MTTSVQSNPFDDKINEDISIQAGSSLFDLNRITNNKNVKIITNPEDYAWLDAYDDDEAEQKFLTDKPKCFLVVGKPGSGKTTIAKKIAGEWRAELISPTDLIQQNIEQGTELGKKAREIFLKGESVSGNMVCEMISNKVNSPEVLHHGYVLDGFPSYSEPSLDVQQQMEMLLNWKLQPDFIIHLKIPDNDLIERRINQKVDPYTGNIYIKDVYRPPAVVITKNKNEDEDEEEEENDGEEENNDEEEEPEPKDEFFAELPNDVVERLVTRPEDSEPNVLESLKLYKDALLRALETHMANMDQSYLFELDANVSPTILTKQVIERLETFQISKAAKALRLSDPPTEIPEEEPPLQTGLGDPVETEEVMQSLSIQQKLSNKFKWRRSKWMRFCPVSLKNGAIINGRPECAAAFLDKVYAMANEQTLKEFLKNPREYIRLPYPRAPCKLSILGDIYSGKTVLANLLAKKYNAKVLDMNLLIQPKIKAAKDELLARVREDTVKTAIETVKQKVREIMEQERIKKEQAEQLLAQAAEEKELEEKENVDQIGETETAGEATIENSDVIKSEEVKPVVAKEKVEETKEIETKNEYLTSSFITITDENDVIVDVNHPDVLSAVEAATTESSKQLVSLPPSDYIEVLEQEIKRVQEERQKLEPTAPSQGGWILDNFPQNSDQLNAMIESNIIPDTFIVLKDSTTNSSVITKRWYNINKTEIDKKIEARMKIEQERRAEELMKKELEKARRIREGEDISKLEEEEAAIERPQTDDDDESRIFSKEQAKRSETLEKIPEEDESKDGVTIGKHLTIPTVTDEPTVDQLTLETGVEPATSEKDYFPTKGPEVDEFLKVVKDSNDKLKNLQNSIANLTGNDAIFIDVNKGLNIGVEVTHKVESKNFDELFSEASMVIERIFKYKSNEYEGGEEEEADEEEEEEAGEEEEEAEEEEEEEGDPTLKDKNVQLGDTNHYCPVSLVTRNMLIPGNPEIQAKYREKIYRFSSDENRQLFNDNPEKYIPSKKPSQVPPIRLLVLGPRGAGKSVQARQLADKLDLFHIKFRDRLQELIIGKLKKPVGPEYEEENEEDEEELSEEEKKKKAEVVPPELTDMEEIIRGYLEKDEALTNDILDNIIGVLWNLEPYKSRGFVLEGFPSNENEVNYLLEKGLFADAALFINVTDDTIVKRLLPAKLDKWRQKMKAKKERREQKKQQKKKELDEKMKRRKYEILYDREQLRLKREAAGEEVEEEEDDVEALVQEEFQDELQEEEVEEDQPEEEAKDGMINEFKANYENQMASIEAIKETFQEVLLPRLSVDGNRKENIVRYLINKRLQKFIDYRESIFERAYPLKYNLAKKLCEFGYKRESRFGKWCPVKLLNGDVFPPLYDDKVKPFPVSYRSNIYYLSSKEAREKFIKNPLHYLKQPSPMPVTPLKLSIIGPPKSGKTTLANRFCKEYGCVRLSIGEAIRMVLEKQPKTDLAKKIKEFLIKGKTVPDELSIQCLEVTLLNSRCQTRGFILDGFPVTKQQVKFLTDRYIIPFKVIELKCDIKEMLQRNVRDLANPELKEKNIVLNTSPEIVAYKYHEWKNEVTVIREWYTESHKNYCQIDGNQSKWLIWDQAKLIAKECVRQIQVYLSRTNNGQAAGIANMCVTYEEMVNRLGDFGQYCPVSLAEKNELVDCSSNKTMDFVAEFQGYYYKMFSANELEQFLSNPEKYIPPQAPRKLPPPELLPQKRTAAQVKEMFTKPAELNGYCSVTYYDGKLRYEALEKGNIEYAVEYRNKLFLMATLDAQEKFLRKPELYAFLKLPHKLPPVKDPMNVCNLPMLGYLEQTVADILIKSLTAVGTFKPKFPFISPTRSSLLYLAYYLKAYNPKSSEYRKKKYKQKLTYFEENCQLIHYLATKTTLKYKEIARLPYDFQTKYESFFALKENVPTMNWLA